MVPASALMLGMSHGATIGYNFQTTGAFYGAPAGAPVTMTAFGVPATNWQSSAPLPTGGGANGSSTISVGGGSINVSWTSANSWGSGIGGGGGPGGGGLQSGEEEVFTGYLDDNYTVTVTGMSSVASSYSVRLFAATDYALAGFMPASLSGSLSGSLSYTNLFTTGFGYAGNGKAAATAFSAAGTGDSFGIAGGPGGHPNNRSTLAGFVIDYTPIVPEPATTGTLLAGLGMLALRRRRN